MQSTFNKNFFFCINYQSKFCKAMVPKKKYQERKIFMYAHFPHNWYASDFIASRFKS